MVPFQQIFPRSNDPYMEVTLLSRYGKAAKGAYTFVESYCTEKGCDCRRVTVLVLSPKGKLAAVIGFGFDPQGPLAGPFLDSFHKQTAAARDLLDIFTSRINEDAEWLGKMHDHYRQVRSHVDGKKYRGKMFPAPGSVLREVGEPPDFSDEILGRLAKETGKPPSRRKVPMKGVAGDLRDAGRPPRKSGKEGLLSLIDSLAKASSMGGGEQFIPDLEEEIRTMLLERPEMDEELAELLPAIVPRTTKEETRINVALNLLSCLLEELRMEMERGRKGSRERMERLQDALARHLFTEGSDANLCSAVGRTLLESRVEILPVIHEANRRRMLFFSDEAGEAPPVDISAYLGESLREMGISDPYEALGIILDQIGLLDPQYQIAIAGEIFASSDPRMRDIAALMLFHPRQDVRSAVAAMLSAAKGESISPETLRRLIIVRNWFPAEIRKGLDTAISNARRAKVECASLKGRMLHSVSATTIDGAGAQSLWIAVGENKHFELCNILWKQGIGVIDTFIHRLPSVKAAERFMDGLPDMMCFADVGPDYVDRAIGLALAAGSARGGAPHRGLLQIAEVIGTDRWKAEPFDAGRELSLLREELSRSKPVVTAAEALRESVDWPAWQDFADAWFEDDDQVDRVVLATMKGKGRAKELRAVDGILAEVLEQRRGPWLERLTLMTLWLKSSPKPAVPWQQMFHLADAVASGVPLKEIPLMLSIAEITFAVALERGGI
jgi:hypothetical protein